VTAPLRRRRRQRIGGLAGIALVLLSLFAGFLAGAYSIALDIGEKLECHAFQLIAHTILAKGGPGATTIEDLGEQDLCQSPYSMAQAMCQDLLDLEVCNLKQLVAEKICPAVDACQSVVDWFTDTKTAIKTWLVNTLKAPAQWLIDHAKLAWNSVAAAQSGIQAALDGDVGPGASDAALSQPGAELDAEVVQEEGGGDPGAAPNDGVPGLEPVESDADLEAGEADCGSACTADELASDSADARDATVLDAVEAAAKETGAIGTAVKVVSKIAGVGLKIAGWVGVAFMAYQFISELIRGYQVSAQTQVAGFHDYSPEDLWYPSYPSCSAAYDTWAEVLQDPTSLANQEFIGAIAGNNDPEAQISSYTDDLFVVNSFLDAATGGLVSLNSQGLSFLPPETMSLYQMWQAATQGGGAPDCPGSVPASSQVKTAITQAYVSDLDIGGYNGAWLLAHPSHLNDNEPEAQQPTWCYPAGYARASDLQSVAATEGDWGLIAQVLSGQIQCPNGPTAGSPGAMEQQPAVAYTELLSDLRAGNDGPYDQLLSEASQVAGSGDDQTLPDDSEPTSQEAALAEKELQALPQAAAVSPVPAPPSDEARTAEPMSEDDAISLLLAASDVLGAGDPSRVATSYVDTAFTEPGDSGAVTGGVGGNIGSTALLASQMVTGFAQASPGTALDPSSPEDQYLATAGMLADDLNQSGGDLNSAYAAYVSQNHLPAYAGSWSGGYSTDPTQAPTGIDEGAELNAGNWGLEAGAYQGSPPAAPTACLLTAAAADWDAYLDSDDLGDDGVTPPTDLLAGQPVPPSELLTVFEDASETYDTSLPLLLAIAAQQSSFAPPSSECEPTGAGGEDFGIMGMLPSVFSDSGPPAGVDMAAIASDADGNQLALGGEEWARAATLPDAGSCPLLGEPAGTLDPTAEVDTAAYLLASLGAGQDAGTDQLSSATQDFYTLAVAGPPSLPAPPSTTGFPPSAIAWAQSVLLVRFPAYSAWLSGGAPQEGSAACSGPIGTICREPATPVFLWVPSTGYPDAFTWGQCTWWADYDAWAISQYGVGGDADGPGQDSWIASALARMPEGSVQLASQGAVPQVGDVVVFLPGGSYNLTLGHVAVVIAVDPDPSSSAGLSGYWISESNFLGLGVVDERHIAWPDPQVRGFILASPQESPLQGGPAS
jgi:surface antigen